MPRSLSFAALLLASATPVLGQRADENVVRAAGDAFGTSIGNEKIGLYDAADVRGFSPSSAGNIRVEGLSVTQHGGFNSRIAGGSTIRVGLTAQGYPFPAPTGIADYALRSAGEDAVLSPVLYLGPNGTKALDLDGQIPILRDRLSLAAGIAYRYEENALGEDSRTFQAGGVLRWRAGDRAEIKAFYARTAIMDDLDVASLFTAGAFLPPKIERRYFGLGWTKTEVRRDFYGALASLRLGEGLQLRAGLFRSENQVLLNPVELYRDVQPDGTAQRQLVVTSDQTARSSSGELRSTWSIAEGAGQHRVHLALRGRETRRAYGGADIRELGPAIIGSPNDLPKPDLHFGPFSRDKVRQLTAGLGYEARWPGIGEVSLGLQKSDYEKSSAAPGRPILRTRDRPWLYNATLALYLSRGLVAYAGYARGLEESGTAPQNAANRNSAPPALRTRQRDAGIRYAVMPRLNLVAGLFDVRKPYFNIDADRIYRQLGAVRHRGVELSLAGEPVPGLSLVAGAVLLDADVSGEAVGLGVIGPKPVGTTKRSLRAALDYRLPFHAPLSLDLGVTSLAGKIASTLRYDTLGGRQLRTGARTSVDIGARYRFKSFARPATLRVQITNLLDAYDWDVSAASAFRFTDARRVQMSLAADL